MNIKKIKFYAMKLKDKKKIYEANSLLAFVQKREIQRLTM